MENLKQTDSMIRCIQCGFTAKQGSKEAKKHENGHVYSIAMVHGWRGWEIVNG